MVVLGSQRRAGAPVTRVGQPDRSQGGAAGPFGVRERRDNHKRGFWTTGHRRAYHEDFRLMVDLESHADLIRWVECETMPGLAQCETYIREQFQACDDQDAAAVEELVQARLARQSVVLDGSTEYRVVMSESCLRRERGGPDVMREQIDHLP